MPDVSPNYRRLLFTLAAVLLIALALTFRLRPALSTPSASPDGSSAATAQPAAVSPVADSPAQDAPRAEEWREPQRRGGVNAANLYADAFALYDRLSDEERALLKKPVGEVDAEQAAQLFEKLQAIEALLRAAAAADYCDWGTGEITFETTLPYLGQAQGLAVAARWAAQYRFPTDPAGAIDNLAAANRLGHHLCDTLIGGLVAGSIESLTHDAVRRQMGSLDPAATQRTLEFVASSTLEADLDRVFKGEASGVTSYGEKLARMDPLERGRELTQIASGLQFSPAQIDDDLAFLRRIYSEAPGALRSPESEFQRWWSGAKSEVSTSRPLARLAMPSLEVVQRQVQTLRVQRTLLAAAADVLQNGPSQLGRHRDPATGGALFYVPTADGFELRSTYLRNGKPVTMSFTTPR
jgi:antitoxin (DNA-binding transcriptional repressor) of toxin-antitoxin stability system